MIEVKALPPDCASLVSIDPGALGGWAYFCRYADSQWRLVSCGLARPAKGERPPLLPNGAVNKLCCVGELPQHQHGDTPHKTNCLFTTSMRLGMLAEATGAAVFWPRSPHSWKGSVDKCIHNSRCLKRLTEVELTVLNSAKSGTGKPVSASELNNVIDAIGLGLVTVGRW